MYLETTRLFMREVMPEDQPMLRAYSLEPASRQYDMPDALSQWEFEQLAVWMVDEQRTIPRTYYYLAVVEQSNPGLMIGSVHLTITSHTHREAEIGYLIGTAYHNHGYATECAQALLTFGFTMLDLTRIAAADIITENTASIRVAEKCGMMLAETRPEAQYFHGRWWDTATYALTKPAWEALPHP